MPILLQPITPTGIIWHYALKQFPELRLVIRMFDMAEFMDHNIIKYVWRRHDQLPVEIEITLGRAAAPAL